jgi:hypothetical protein
MVMKRSTTGGGGLRIEVVRGRTNPRELQRIENDGNTTIKTASQPGHRKTPADRLNAIIATVSPEHANRVRSGVWGTKVEMDVDPDLHTDEETRTLAPGQVVREERLVGAAPYSIQEIGDGRTIVRLNLPNGAVQVGVGASIDAALDDLEVAVARGTR